MQDVLICEIVIDDFISELKITVITSVADPDPVGSGLFGLPAQEVSF